MPSEARELSRSLKTRRRALLQRYSDEDLHKLRVSLRRMRSLLKLQPDTESRELRRELGELARATNAARDWDTCYSRLSESPAYSGYAQLEPLLAKGRRKSHRRVRRMLRSSAWSSSLRRWKHYIATTKLTGDRSAADTNDPVASEQALAAAARRALSQEDERSWHKLRIAVKDFRYQLEHSLGGESPGEAVAALRRCMALQDELGKWHDTVAHRDLLLELSEGLDSRKDRVMIEAIGSLCHQLEEEGRDILTRVRQYLQKVDGTGRLAG